ncbi:MAG: hypothetical protein HY097_01905 [Nitrospinae bacterium]|nr:hypothetical protein [Nitrospinota bacterium]
MQNYWKKLKIILIILAVPALLYIWHVQFKDEYRYQRLVATKIGFDLTELNYQLVNDKKKDDKLAILIQKELRELEIPLSKSELKVLVGLKDKGSSNEHILKLENKIINMLKVDRVDTFFKFGKQWNIAKNSALTACSGSIADPSILTNLERDISALSEHEKAIANVEGSAAEDFLKVIKDGGDFKSACKGFISKDPLEAANRLIL